MRFQLGSALSTWLFRSFLCTSLSRFSVLQNFLSLELKNLQNLIKQYPSQVTSTMVLPLRCRTEKAFPENFCHAGLFSHFQDWMWWTFQRSLIRRPKLVHMYYPLPVCLSLTSKWISRSMRECEIISCSLSSACQEMQPWHQRKT